MSIFDKDVAIRKTMGELVEERNSAVMLWEHGYKLLEKAKGVIDRTCRYGGPTTYETLKPEQAKRKIDEAYWRAAFERTRMTEIMDAKASKEFHDSLEKNPPEFSLVNIENQYLMMYQQADEMFLRGIYEVFRSLDHSYWNNNHEPYQISSRNILRGILDSWSVDWGHVAPRLSYYKSDWLNDVDRCVKVLTGRRHNPRELETSINAALKEQGPDGPPWIYEDDDYHMKFFKNCNCHLVLKNQDTIDRLNRSIAEYCNHHQLKEAA